MIDRNEVFECLKELGSAEEKDMNGLGAIIDFACESVNAQLENEDVCTDRRAVFLAAARANYILACSDCAGGGFDSFSAGDVSFSAGSGSVQQAKAVLDEAEKFASRLTGGSAFAFRGV